MAKEARLPDCVRRGASGRNKASKGNHGRLSRRGLGLGWLRERERAEAWKEKKAASEGSRLAGWDGC